MKKLISILLLSTLVLSGCGAKSNKIQQPQQQVQDDDEEMSWFEDEVLDMDDWGETKHKKKVMPKTGVATPSTTKPSTNVKPSVTPKSSSTSSSNTKSGTTKKK